MAGIPILALGLLCSPAQGQSGATVAIDGVHLYQGTIGKQEIVLEIGEADDRYDARSGNRYKDKVPDQEVEGRYFYRQHGLAILVEGTFLKDGSLRVQEYVHDLKPSGAEWRLWFHDNTATGFFCRCDARHSTRAGDSDLKITLGRVSHDIDPGLDLGDRDEARDKAYYGLLLDFPLRSGPETMVSRQAGYVAQADERFKVSLPHLTHFPNEKVMNRVNLDLARELAGSRVAAARTLQGLNFTGGDWEEHMRVAAFSDVVLSIVRSLSYYSGGANHPNGGIDALVYDMRTGAVLDLKDFFEAQDTSAILHNGVVPKGPTHDLLVEFYKRHYAKPRDCDTSGEFTVDDFTSDTTLRMYFDHIGLVIAPELAHAIAGCGPEVTIPYQELRPFLRDNLRSHWRLDVWPN